MAPSADRETKDRRVLEKQMWPAETRRRSTSEYHWVYLVMGDMVGLRYFTSYLEAMVGSPALSACCVCCSSTLLNTLVISMLT